MRPPHTAAALSKLQLMLCSVINLRTAYASATWAARPGSALPTLVYHTDAPSCATHAPTAAATSTSSAHPCITILQKQQQQQQGKNITTDVIMTGAVVAASSATTLPARDSVDPTSPRHSGHWQPAKPPSSPASTQSSIALSGAWLATLAAAAAASLPVCKLAIVQHSLLASSMQTSTSAASPG